MMRWTLCIIPTALVLSMMSANAHEAVSGWQYPWECCHSLDCAEISSNRVKFDVNGYVIDGRYHVRAKDVRPSPDGRYHACFPTPDKLRCFFAPPMGF